MNMRDYVDFTRMQVRHLRNDSKSVRKCHDLALHITTYVITFFDYDNIKIMLWYQSYLSLLSIIVTVAVDDHV